MIRNVLVIVPHPDDELNIAGFLLESLIENNVGIFILYVTKGDFYKEKYIARQKERDKVLKIFGNLSYIQLGYADSYIAENHLFNDVEKRRRIKCDIKYHIKKLLCDMIICVDYDSHADHRMVSALFDEIMHELIKEENYRPIVLKKFAYLGVWGGENDFFSEYPIATKASFSADDDNEYINCLPYKWSERIRIQSNAKDFRLAFWKSKVFKAYCSYFTQCGFVHFFRAANSDVVYWYRNTNNLALTADVQVSSGYKKYINDFAIANIDQIEKDFSGDKRFKKCAWSPDVNDKKKCFKLSWERPVTIESFAIYQNFNAFGHINIFTMEMSNGFVQSFTCSNEDSDYYSIKLQEDIIWVKISIVDGIGEVGIREFELYSDKGTFPWEETPFRRYSKIDVKRRHIVFYKTIEKIYWTILRAVNKIRKFLKISSW